MELSTRHFLVLTLLHPPPAHQVPRAAVTAAAAAAVALLAALLKAVQLHQVVLTAPPAQVAPAAPVEPVARSLQETVARQAAAQVVIPLAAPEMLAMGHLVTQLSLET